MKLSSFSFAQEMHSAGPSDQEEASLRLSLEDAGGGEYLVLNATEWAIDSEEEIDELAARMKELLRSAEQGNNRQLPHSNPDGCGWGLRRKED